MESEMKFTPSAARNEPLTIHGCANEHVNALPNEAANHNFDEEAAIGEDERGDLSIRGLWTAGADHILDVFVTNTDVESFCK
jgi:hypothetical protein